jgi:hypothetical protein
MTILGILKIIGALATIATGLFSMLRPHAIKGFTGLEASSPRAVTEIRAVMGGVFIGLGISPFLLGGGVPYQVLGIMYLVIAAVRTASMVFDHSIMQSNMISLGIEIVFGIILVL